MPRERILPSYAGHRLRLNALPGHLLRPLYYRQDSAFGREPIGCADPLDPTLVNSS